jgi:hypothetical protein
MHFHLLARDEHLLHVVVLVHKVVVVVMLPGSDLPSTYNHALWWTLEDMWEVVGSLPTTSQRRWPSLWPYGCRGGWQRVVLVSVWL